MLNLFVWEVGSTFMEDMKNKYSAYPEAVGDINECVGGCEVKAKNDNGKFCFWIPNCYAQGVGVVGYEQNVEDVADIVAHESGVKYFHLECSDDLVATKLISCFAAAGIVAKPVGVLDPDIIKENIRVRDSMLMKDAKHSTKH